MKLSILVLTPGRAPVVKGPFLDNADGFRAQLEGVKELRRLNPDATIIPLTVRAGGQVWAESEEDFLMAENVRALSDA